MLSDRLSAARAAASALAAQHLEAGGLLASSAAAVATARAAAAALAAKQTAAAAAASRPAAAASSSAAATLATAPTAPTTAPTAAPAPTTSNHLDAARAAAQKLAQQMSSSTSAASASASASTSASASASASACASAATPAPAVPNHQTDADSAKRAAAAASFAESLKKRPRWGDGTTTLAATDDASSSSSSNPQSAAKQRQALAVSQLQDKLALIRKDRGTTAPTDANAAKKTLKLFIPPPPEGREPRNWVGLLIGRDGINRKRLLQSTGATLYLRGRGTELRGQTALRDQVDKRGRLTEAGEAMEEMHVVLEADTDESLEAARVQVMMIIDPPDKSSALTLFQEGQLEKAAEQKTTKTEECAFCGKPGHHHSKCPKRRSTFSMAGLFCAACGKGGHTARDCKGDRSGIVNGHTRPPGSAGAPSVFEDDDFAAFQAELAWRS